MCVYAAVCYLRVSVRRGQRSPRTELRGNCEPTDMGARNRTWVSGSSAK